MIQLALQYYNRSASNKISAALLMQTSHNHRYRTPVLPFNFHTLDYRLMSRKLCLRAIRKLERVVPHEYRENSLENPP